MRTGGKFYALKAIYSSLNTGLSAHKIWYNVVLL